MLQPTTTRERALRRVGYRAIAGVDEAGRGALAGPLVAAAVILPAWFRGLGLRDSKLLSPAAREHHYRRIVSGALAWAIHMEPASAIDREGIQTANLRALATAVARLSVPADVVLVDGFALALPVPSHRIIHGDATVLSIAAASVVAKVTRDRLMVALARRYALYGFAQHKGYGTLAHRRRLARHGPSPVHRRSFHVSRLKE